MGAPGAEKAVGFRWRNDDGTEVTATWIAAENTDAPALPLDTPIRLRVVTNPNPVGSAGTPISWANNHNGAGNVTITTTSSKCKAVNSANVTDGAGTTKQMSASSGDPTARGTITEDGTQTCAATGTSQTGEYEIVLQFVSADGVGEGESGTITFDGGGGSDVTIGYTTEVTAVPAYEQNTHRGRNDDGSETTATWKAAAGADYSQAVDEIFRQRFLIKCTGAGEAGFKPTVEYRVNHAGAGYGAWTTVAAGTPVSTKSMEVVRVDSANLTHGADTTQQLGAGTFTSDNNGVIENGALATLTSVVDEEWEVEVALFLGRIANAPGDLYQFRITNDGVALDTYTDTPEVTCLGATPPHTDTPAGSGGGIRRFMFHLGG